MDPDILPSNKTRLHCSIRSKTFISLCQFAIGMKHHELNAFYSERKCAKVKIIKAIIIIWSNILLPSFASTYLLRKYKIG